MGVVMVMFRADGQRRSFSITRDMTVVGRREDCDLRIPLSDVSRKHCLTPRELGCWCSLLPNTPLEPLAAEFGKSVLLAPDVAWYPTGVAAAQWLVRLACLI